MAGSYAIRVPGKAMLAGEYAVLAGAPAMALAVRRYLTCRASPASADRLEAMGRTWVEGAPVPDELRFAHQALEVARRYLEGAGLRAPPLALSLSDELRAADGRKLGLGGSACAAVAVAAAALESAGRSPEAERALLFKLAALAHALAQGQAGSAVDVAASTFGGTLWTFRAEVAPLAAAMRAGPAPFAAAVDRATLPERAKVPDPPDFLLAFSGSSASTPSLVGRVEKFAAREPRLFAEFVARASAACDRLRRGLGEADLARAQEALGACGEELSRLGERAGVPIVTPEHRALAEAAREEGAAAKTSGAGGGDCAIALGTPEAVERLARRLSAGGTEVVRGGVDASGAVVLRAP